MEVTDWPTLNALVWLRLPCCGAEHPTRVEGVEDDVVVVGTPAAPHSDFVRPFDADEAFFLGWVMGRGAIEVPVVLTSHGDDPIPTWTLRKVGEPTETQRRNFVRLDIPVEVKVKFALSLPAETVTTDDLSEGGMRFRVSKWILDPGASSFAITMDLAGKTLDLTGQVVSWEDIDSYGTRTVRVKFLNLQPTEADVIRGFVFSAQVERRRRTQ